MNDILEQANNIAKDGNDKVKQELLQDVGKVVEELRRLTSLDEEFCINSLGGEIREVQYQHFTDLESAMINTLCTWLFCMLEDCERSDFYQLTMPDWLKDWYIKADAWDKSADGLLAVKAE